MMLRPAFARWLAGAILLALAAMPIPGGADESRAPQRITSQGPLDGLAFTGRLGPADATSDRLEDTLYFRAGHFWSAVCTPCGFMPGRYWVHRTAEGIHFRGRLTSPDSGVFTYEGTVHDDGRVSADINWRKERWYWTIDRDFRFEGTRAEERSVATLEEVRASARSALREGASCDPR